MQAYALVLRLDVTYHGKSKDMSYGDSADVKRRGPAEDMPSSLYAALPCLAFLITKEIKMKASPKRICTPSDAKMFPTLKV